MNKNSLYSLIRYTILIIIIVVIITLFNTKNNQIDHFTLNKVESNDTIIPKQIWAYWNDNIIPPIINKCINNWKNMNPDHKIVIITPNNINKLIKEDDISSFDFASLTPQRQSDWIRLYVLHKYGGIWIDSSTILTNSFKWLHNKNSTAFGYYIKKFTTNQNYPVIESWFIASTSTNEFINLWFKEFDYACKKFNNDGNAYLMELKQLYGPDKYNELVHNIESPDYLTIHMAAQKIMQINNIKPFIEKEFSEYHKNVINGLKNKHLSETLEIKNSDGLRSPKYDHETSMSPEAITKDKPYVVVDPMVELNKKYPTKERIFIMIIYIDNLNTKILTFLFLLHFTSLFLFS